MTDRKLRVGRVALLAISVGLAGAARAERCATHDPLRRPFFGDLHVHTRYSLDASTQGTRTTPDEAYRFARGETLGLHPFGADGKPLRSVRLERPLDFAAVTDHAELLGEAATCNTPGLPGYDSFTCRVYRGWPRLAFFLMNSRGSPRFRFCGPDAVHCRSAARGPWSEVRSAAAAADDGGPACTFTTFVALEWTAQGAGARNLHRNVIFRSDVVPEVPPNAIDQPTPEALWDELDRSCLAPAGCEAVIIPHNSNLSGELMFQTVSATGEPIDTAAARRRAAAEPLVEIMQHKGASECRRSTAPADELCGFEELPYDRFMGRYLALAREDAKPMSFTRHALAEGLVTQTRLGANPFAFGVIASTDTHLGTPGLVAESSDYPGHGGAGTPIGDEIPDRLIDAVEFNPGGLAVLWAEENSRDSLFRAMRRREAYGTSGPRIVLRVFGGWELSDALCEHGELVAEGYRHGVPMGGDLPPRPPGRTPTLAIWALQDPGTALHPGTKLQRLQIVKAWVEDGRARERVIEVAGDPELGRVDPASCEPSGAGFDSLCRVWSDPDFDSSSPALYYVRAVEAPTCRWHTRACLARGIDCREGSRVPDGYQACCDTLVPRTLQERAWSSPIWYTPGSGLRPLPSAVP
ncbi:MAG: DUF3604 domain-containing protein [Myxococcota bacterium]